MYVISFHRVIDRDTVHKLSYKLPSDIGEIAPKEVCRGKCAETYVLRQNIGEKMTNLQPIS